MKELIEYETGSNRIENIDALKRGAEQVAMIPDRTMVCNDVQGCTSVAGAGCTGATDVGRLYQLTENSVLKAEYIYNDLGQRTKKTLYQTDGITVASTTIYHYDQMGYLITETTETGTLIKDYIWNEMHPVAQIDAVIPAQAGIQSIEAITYLYTDHLMTNRLATGQSKTIIWRWEGEAFGNSQAQELSGVSVNLRFPGQYYDSETNLHYNHFRYYDPALGRYITSDPVGLAGGLNTYSYVYQNTIRFFDINGLTATCPYLPPIHNSSWRPYAGNTYLFHCGFSGFIEVREDECDKSPLAECFYDDNGRLVDENHAYWQCMGTPDTHPWWHYEHWGWGGDDPGGVWQNPDAFWKSMETLLGIER